MRSVYLLIKAWLSTHEDYIQWNLSNPTHQGTREMGGIVQDVGKLMFYFS